MRNAGSSLAVLLLMASVAGPVAARPEYYRRDGVRITHDPYAAGVAAKYGSLGNTDPEGFDPYADAVGPGIYGGTVLHNADGRCVAALRKEVLRAVAPWHCRSVMPLYAAALSCCPATHCFSC